MRTFLAHAKPPVYTIIEVGKPTTKAELSEINQMLENAGSSTRVHFEKAKGVRVYAIGHPYLQGSRLLEPLFCNYLVIHPSGSVVQTNNINGFIIKED